MATIKEGKERYSSKAAMAKHEGKESKATEKREDKPSMTKPKVSFAGGHVSKNLGKVKTGY